MRVQYFIVYRLTLHSTLTVKLALLLIESKLSDIWLLFRVRLTQHCMMEQEHVNNSYQVSIRLSTLVVHACLNPFERQLL